MGAEDRIIDSVIGLVIVVTILGATAGLVLTAFTNLSGAGLALSVLFATVLPILFAVFAYKVARAQMKRVS